MPTKKVFEKSTFENMPTGPAPAPAEPTFIEPDEAPEDTEGAMAALGIDDDLNLGGGEGAWGGDLDIDFGGADLAVEEAVDDKPTTTVTMGDSLQTKWLRKRKLPADLVAAGEFEEALNLLKRRLGLINADPLEPLFKAAYWATCSSLPGLPHAPSLNIPLLSEGSAKGRDLAPLTLYTINSLSEQVREGYQQVAGGKFAEAVESFRAILQCIPLGIAKDARE